MLTPRGWMLLFLDVLLLVFVVVFYSTTLAVICLALLSWFLGEWLLFVVRVGLVRRGLSVWRQVRDERGAVDSLWAGWNFEVEVELRATGSVGVPYARVSDWVPFNVERIRGEVETDGPLGKGRPLRLSYRMHCRSAGQVRFEGVGVQFCDLHGLFYLEIFVAGPRVFRVLPPLTDIKGHAPAAKRHNLMPLFGIHRHRRPGSGSELLDLREYFPGDPPKTIAWKASARRDKLMTKEFESEVPVRCTLFVDTSHSVRVGRQGGNALARLIEISSGVVQASLGARDLTGLCLFDEKSTAAVRPARGRRHLIQLLHRLADAASLAPSSGETKLPLVLPLAYGLAYEVYPEQFRQDLNAFPWYLPVLFPQPAWTMRRPAWGDRLATRLNWFAPRMLALGLFSFASLVSFSLVLVASGEVRSALGAVAWGFGSLFLGAAPMALTLPFNTLRLLSGVRGRQYLQRKRLAALLAVRHGLGPGGLPLLMEDEERLTVHLQRFLAEHQVPYPLSLYDDKGRYLFTSPEKVHELSGGLLAAVGKGHDNELFVLLADLLELDEPALEPLLRAIKVARARHHRVLVVCPWPPGVPPPSEKPRRRRRRRRGEPDWLRRAVLDAMFGRLHRAFRKLRRTFARLGVQVVCAENADSVSLILRRLDQLRSVQRGAR
jgi:uncharacterized protein (DUF58 family)